MNNLLEEIEYYKRYKRNLYQFLIINCCYLPTTKVHKRIIFNHHEMLQLLKEISALELLIYKLKTEFSIQSFESY